MGPEPGALRAADVAAALAGGSASAPASDEAEADAVEEAAPAEEAGEGSPE